MSSSEGLGVEELEPSELGTKQYWEEAYIRCSTLLMWHLHLQGGGHLRRDRGSWGGLVWGGGCCQDGQLARWWVNPRPGLT